MYAMQYQVGLPADYDMKIIRERVRKTGHLMDGFAGLEFKAYLIQEKDQGAPRNAYAPFYVWRDIDGMRNFIWGEPGYSSIVRDFGRQPIQDWTVHRLVVGSGDYGQAKSLSMRSVPLPTGAAPVRCLDAVTEQFLAKVGESTIALVTAVDVTTWNAVLVELSSNPADENAADAFNYEVLHISTAV